MPAAGTEILVAIDVGTSGARATAFDLAGERQLEVRRSYPTASPRPGWAEQDPRAWRSAALAALAGLVRQLESRGRVLAIGLTGQCPSVCLVDADGAPLGPGLIYRDNRATAEAAAISERFGDTAIHARTGHLPAAFHVAPKLIWLQAHDPATFGQARRALQPRDLVAHALTGETATDGTHAAATLLFDIRRREWARDLQDAMHLPAELFPPLRPSSEPLGGLAGSVAHRVGLPPGMPVILGGADSQACALGAGVVAPGPVSEMAGSSTCLNAAVPEPLTVLEVTHFPHVVPGPFTTETGINTTGAAIAWVADLLYAPRGRRAGAADYARLDREVNAVPPGADGVLALPILGDGERTDPDLRGALTGLSLRHDRAIVARAVLEGVAFAIRDQLGLITAAGPRVTELRVSGGDTRLASWNRIKADVIGIPVVTVPGDAAVTGVAMLAGLGAGVYRDVEDAIRRCVRLAPPIEPDSGTKAQYDERFAAWRELAATHVARRQA
jgi:sugar (pentulose or hexulose) kinase